MMMVTHRTLTQSKVNSKHRRTFLSRWNHSCVCSFRWISALICTRCHHQLVIWIRYAGRRPRYSLISTEVTSTASVLLLLIMLCSSAELFAPLARVQHWRRHRRSRAQVYQRIIGARASLQARSRAYKRARVKKRASTWLRILSLFLPSNKFQDHPLSLMGWAGCDVFTAVVHGGRFAAMKQANLRLFSLNLQACPPALWGSIAWRMQKRVSRSRSHFNVTNNHNNANNH